MALAVSPLGSVSLTSIGLSASDLWLVLTTLSTYLSLPVSSPAAKLVGEEAESILQTGPSAYACALARLPTPSIGNAQLATSQTHLNRLRSPISPTSCQTTDREDTSYRDPRAQIHEATSLWEVCSVRRAPLA